MTQFLCTACFFQSAQCWQNQVNWSLKHSSEIQLNNTHYKTVWTLMSLKLNNKEKANCPRSQLTIFTCPQKILCVAALKKWMCSFQIKVHFTIFSLTCKAINGKAGKQFFSIMLKRKARELLKIYFTPTWTPLTVWSKHSWWKEWMHVNNPFWY